MADDKPLYPIVMPVPESQRDLKGREKVVFLSRLARQALHTSVEKSGFDLDHPEKDENGVPMPTNGVYWSVSHKQAYVCAIVSDRSIGIDIEKIQPCSDALFKRIADKKEWALAGDISFRTFFRFWTAKETVLKATGDGIKGLSHCRITRIPDPMHLAISYANREWVIEHFFFHRHIASIVQDEREVVWTIMGDWTRK